MMPLSAEVMLKISSLQWLNAEQIKSQFADLLQDAQNCRRVDILRSVVIYRLQERFYGKGLSPETKRLLDRVVAGSLMRHAPADDFGKSAKKLGRIYKGVRYEVMLFADGTCEYNGRRLGSLTAAAKEITGSHWNGRQFFGVK